MISSITEQPFIVAVLVTWMLGACSSGGHTSSPACAAQARQACTGPGGCRGEQTCQAATRTWSACNCGDAPDAGAREAAVLGATCEDDQDCPNGAFCLRNDSDRLFGGAPPTGTCAANCSSDGGCGGFGNAICVDVADPLAAARDGGTATHGLCFERCQIGSAATGAAVVKCHDREHIACSPLEGSSAGTGFCRPICATGGECLSGVCDPRRSVCVASVPTDPSFGLRCSVAMDAGAGDVGGGGDAGGDRDAGADRGSADDGPRGSADGGDAAPSGACAGICVGLGPGAAICSRRCRFGSSDECAPENDSRRRGGCLFVTKGGGIGDLGYCAELCDCNGDCADPSFVCDAFDDATLQSAFARRGVCAPPELVVNRPLPCATN